MKSLRLVFGLLLCASALFARGKAEDDSSGLLAAAVNAVDLEISSTRSKMEAAEGDARAAFQQKIKGLEAERDRLHAMKPGDYPEPAAMPAGGVPVGVILPPARAEAVITVSAPLSDGSLLDVQGASRSGPFYHLAGIRGGDYGILKPGRTYTVTLALVYRREYFGFIGDYYAFVMGVK